jgi:hypothetical protein
MNTRHADKPVEQIQSNSGRYQSKLETIIQCWRRFNFD